MLLGLRWLLGLLRVLQRLLERLLQRLLGLWRLQVLLCRRPRHHMRLRTRRKAAIRGLLVRLLRLPSLPLLHAGRPAASRPAAGRRLGEKLADGGLPLRGL